jgi:hypothetical protein
MVEKDALDKYKKLAETGNTPEQVYLTAQNDGYNMIDVWCITGSVFRLKLIEVKEVSLRANGIANSLDEHELSLIPHLEKAFRMLEEEEQKANEDEQQK